MEKKKITQDIMPNFSLALTIPLRRLSVDSCGSICIKRHTLKINMNVNVKMQKNTSSEPSLAKLQNLKKMCLLTQPKLHYPQFSDVFLI